MKLKFRKPKSQLDEMQEQLIVKAESNGCKLAAASLGIALIVQTLNGAPPSQWFGEFVVLEVLCVYMIFCSVKNGIWDRHFKPGIKNYLACSFICAAAVSLLTLGMVILYGPIWSVFADIAGMFALTFISCLVGMGIFGTLCKKCRAKLDKE